MLLPASSSNGKTLLTARLLSLGCEYCSDEAVLLRRDGTVRPIPTALSVKTGGAEALSAHFPGSLELPEHDREDGVAVRYLSPPPASLPALGRAARPELLVFPRFVPNAPTTLRPLSSADALARLLAECLAIPHRGNGRRGRGTCIGLGNHHRRVGWCGSSVDGPVAGQAIARVRKYPDADADRNHRAAPPRQWRPPQRGHC
jgi:hypothetical protein